MTDDNTDKTEKDMDRASRISQRDRSRRDRDRGGRDRDDRRTDDESQKSKKSQTSNMDGEVESGETETVTPDELSEKTGSSVTISDESPENQPIKDRNHVPFYLRDEFQQEFNRLTAGAIAEAEAVEDVSLADNRHIRPLALKLGAERMKEMDPEDLVDKLANDDVLDDPRA